jgi:hypothetical protein
VVELGDRPLARLAVVPVWPGDALGLDHVAGGLGVGVEAEHGEEPAFHPLDQGLLAGRAGGPEAPPNRRGRLAAPPHARPSRAEAIPALGPDADKADVMLTLSLFEPILESQPRHFLEISPIGREKKCIIGHRDAGHLQVK